MDFTFGNGSTKDGIIVDQAKIVAAELAESTFSDVSLKLTLDIGKEFQPKMFINGTYKREGDVVVGVGSMMKVGMVFTELGIPCHFSDDKPFPTEALAKLVGKEIFRLRFYEGDKDGKASYADYAHIKPANDPDNRQTLRELFLKDVEKGFIKSYAPQSGEPLPAASTEHVF